MDKQKAKVEQGVKRNCTEGISGEFQLMSMQKKKQRYKKGRFSAKRCQLFFKLLRGRSNASNEANNEAVSKDGGGEEE